MLMQPKGDLDVVHGLVLDDRQSAAIARAQRDRSIRIRNIDAASKRIVDDYPDMAAWFCLSVRHRAEFAVEKDLKASGIIACVPRCTGEKKLHRGRMLEAPILPVIPGYMLVRCVPSATAFVGLRSIDRVTGIIGRGEIPYRVPAKKIEHFISLAAEGEYDHRPVECHYIVGQTVRVCEGPFASFDAIVIDVSRVSLEGRINVEVNIFGRMTPVELAIAQVEKV